MKQRPADISTEW